MYVFEKSRAKEHRKTAIRDNLFYMTRIRTRAGVLSLDSTNDFTRINYKRENDERATMFIRQREFAPLAVCVCVFACN